MMAARPILFSAPMVRAILEGRKTQTRRVAKPRRANSILGDNFVSGPWDDSYIFDAGNADWLAEDAPAKAGDLLWVKENYRLDECYDGAKPTEASEWAAVHYEADGTLRLHDGCVREITTGKLRPSLFMRRCWSRLDLLVVAVRLERLQDCSEADAMAEGVFRWNIGAEISFGNDPTPLVTYPTATAAYAALWNSINGPGAWEANPLAWVISFQSTRL